MSNAECAKIEKLTRGQNKSHNWFECRKGRLKSSNFGTICKLKPETDTKTIFKTLLHYMYMMSPFQEINLLSGELNMNPLQGDAIVNYIHFMW